MSSVNTTQVPRNHKMCFVPQRYILSVFSVAVVFAATNFSFSLDVAMPHILKLPPQNSTEAHNRTSFCFKTQVLKPLKQVDDNHYDWDSSDRHSIARAFAWGFHVALLPSGVISDKYGGKLIPEISLLLSTITAAITPRVVYYSNGHYFVMAFLQFLMGIGMGMVYPPINSVLAHWTPMYERGRLACWPYLGNSISQLFNFLTSDFVMRRTNSWACIFYMHSVIGIIMCLLWHVFTSSKPQKSHFIDEQELTFINTALGRRMIHGKKTIPWKKMLLSLPVWALIMVQTIHWNLVLVMVEEIPTYFTDVLGIDRWHVQLCSALLELVFLVGGVVSGALSDYIIKRDYLHITTTRKILTTFGAFGPAVFILTKSYVECAVVMSVVLLLVGVSFMGCYVPGTRVNSLDLAPNFSGTILGLALSFGIAPEYYVHYIVKINAPNGTIPEWREVYWIFIYICIVANLFYMSFGSGGEQPWNAPETKD